LCKNRTSFKSDPLAKSAILIDARLNAHQPTRLVYDFFDFTGGLSQGVTREKLQFYLSGTDLLSGNAPVCSSRKWTKHRFASADADAIALEPG
jgi:hypothetical protein